MSETTNDKVRVGAAIFARYPSGSILLIERGPNVMCPGTWGLPGGRVEFGETPRATALRELREEVDVTAAPDDVEYLGYTVTTAHEGGLQWITHLFEVYTNQKPRNAEPDKHTRIAWFREHALPENLMPALGAWFDRPGVGSKEETW